LVSNGQDGTGALANRGMRWTRGEGDQKKETIRYASHIQGEVGTRGEGTDLVVNFLSRAWRRGLRVGKSGARKPFPHQHRPKAGLSIRGTPEGKVFGDEGSKTDMKDLMCQRVVKQDSGQEKGRAEGKVRKGVCLRDSEETSCSGR